MVLEAEGVAIQLEACGPTLGEAMDKATPEGEDELPPFREPPSFPTILIKWTVNISIHRTRLTSAES
jgi:hypothetical protein